MIGTNYYICFKLPFSCFIGWFPLIYAFQLRRLCSVEW